MKTEKMDYFLEYTDEIMPRKPVLVILGTRPEAIKLSTVITELAKSKVLLPVVVSTGQHGEILESAMADLQIFPDESLSTMYPNQTLAESAARILAGLSPLYNLHKPVITLVQGDTTTALMGALTSFYCNTPVGHVEAGLRTENPHLPFPEEANRRQISVISDLHFAPTRLAEKNLVDEGFSSDSVFLTGNTGVDTLLEMNSKIQKSQYVPPESIKLLSDLPNIVLVTCHRRETFGRPFAQICDALATLAMANPNVNIVFPVHPNPNIKEAAVRNFRDIENIYLINPLPYGQFVSILTKARVIITDSGGVQEEAPTLGKRIIVLREITERGEAVKNGMATMVGSDKSSILKAVKLELEQSDENKNPTSTIFGDGSASNKIVRILEEFLSEK